MIKHKELTYYWNAPYGIPNLDSYTLVPTALLGTGATTTTVFLRGDRTWAAPPGGSSSSATPSMQNTFLMMGG